MKSSDLTVGQTYAFTADKYGSRRNDLTAYRLSAGTLVSVRNGNATLALTTRKDSWNGKDQNGEHVTVPTSYVKGLWTDRVAALKAQQERQDESQRQAEAEVARRQAGAKTLTALLGKDWESKYDVGYVGEAAVYDDGRYGKVAHGSDVKVTTAVLADLVQAAYEAGKAAK